MTQDELLRFVVRVLDGLALRYFVTGSVAAIYYGEPRFTNDIDVVVDLPEARIPELCAAFPVEAFYLSEEAVRRAVGGHGTFIVIHPASGLKVDVMIPADTVFNRLRFSRVKNVRPAGDYEAHFASAEDVILKKMEFFREGGSEKHLRDISGILKVSGERLDFDYIEDWAEATGLETIWRTIRYLVQQT